MNKSFWKSIIPFVCLVCSYFSGQAQVTTISGDYIHKVINAAANGHYTNSLILLHEIYDGTLIGDNYTVGTIVARRGAATDLNRLNVANINSSSAYNAIYANLISNDEDSFSWKLKTCKYNGKRYLALDVPYLGAHHTHGFQFSGWTRSTGTSLEFVVYAVNGVPQNTNVLSEIVDYKPTRQLTHHVSNFNILGKVGIGTNNPTEELSVKGNIRAHQIKVESTASTWPDYVFKDDYQIPSLVETEKFIKENGHLSEVPKAETVGREGYSLNEMDKTLLKKIEEITLHLIQKDKEVTKQHDEIDNLKNVIEQLRTEIKMKK
ncbi:hypothetical protein [Sphingobacterium anhuiense]|uniref:Uncharacterized protein n=1 Tax=Sphingobacterium anhuiense TaxID=493780 RepID=A0ABW5YVI8_9SPHI